MKLEQLQLKRVTETLDAVVKARRSAREAARRLKAVAHAHRPSAKLLERRLRQVESMLEGQRLKIPEYNGFRGFLEPLAQAMADEQTQLAELESQLKRLRKAVQARAAKAIATPPKERKAKRKAKKQREAREVEQDTQLYEQQRALMQELNRASIAEGAPLGTKLWALTIAIIDRPAELGKPGVVEERIRADEDLSRWIRQLLELRNVVWKRHEKRLEKLPYG